jgi:hypothetical protein
MVILKLDFDKTFDKVHYSFIISILQSKGFGSKWCHWILQILRSATSSVLLNGVPGSLFHFKGGVGHGDHLSPLLLVLAIDFFANHSQRSHGT